MSKMFWEIEADYLEKRRDIEIECEEAENLRDAILTGINLVYVDGDWGGYLQPDGNFALYGEFEGMTEEELSKVGVEFIAIAEDEDGYTVAKYNKKGEQQ